MRLARLMLSHSYQTFETRLSVIRAGSGSKADEKPSLGRHSRTPAEAQPNQEREMSANKQSYLNVGGSQDLTSRFFSWRAAGRFGGWLLAGLCLCGQFHAQGGQIGTWLQVPDTSPGAL